MSLQVHTYHCICSELVIALFSPLEKLSKRQSDGSQICRMVSLDPVDDGFILWTSVDVSEQPIVLKLEDGFEKRYAIRCKTCGLQFAYSLDWCCFREEQGKKEGDSGSRLNVVYLLAGGLMSTEDVKGGREMGTELEVVASAAG